MRVATRRGWVVTERELLVEQMEPADTLEVRNLDGSTIGSSHWESTVSGVSGITGKFMSCFDDGEPINLKEQPHLELSLAMETIKASGQMSIPKRMSVIGTIKPGKLGDGALLHTVGCARIAEFLGRGKGTVVVPSEDEKLCKGSGINAVYVDSLLDTMMDISSGVKTKRSRLQVASRDFRYEGPCSLSMTTSVFRGLILSVAGLLPTLVIAPDSANVSLWASEMRGLLPAPTKEEALVLAGLESFNDNHSTPFHFKTDLLCGKMVKFLLDGTQHHPGILSGVYHGILAGTATEFNKYEKLIWSSIAAGECPNYGWPVEASLVVHASDNSMRENFAIIVEACDNPVTKSDVKRARQGIYRARKMSLKRGWFPGTASSQSILDTFCADAKKAVKRERSRKAALLVVARTFADLHGEVSVSAECVNKAKVVALWP